MRIKAAVPTSAFQHQDTLKQYFREWTSASGHSRLTAARCMMTALSNGTAQQAVTSQKIKKRNKIDELRKKYPLRICRIGEPQYEAVLAGVQPLSNGKEFPMYRFPGGISCQDPFEPGIKIVEW